MGYHSIKSISSIDINPKKLRTSFWPILDLATPRILQPLQMLDSMRTCQGSDPRDRIYTAQVFGLYLRPEVYVSPDYAKSIKEVFIEWTVNYVKVCNDLDILNCAGGSELPGLPTWVPDWMDISYSSGTNNTSTCECRGSTCNHEAQPRCDGSERHQYYLRPFNRLLARPHRKV